MKTRKLGIALVAAMLAATPFASFAQEAEDDYKPFSGTLAPPPITSGAAFPDQRRSGVPGGHHLHLQDRHLCRCVESSNVDFGAGDPDWSATTTSATAPTSATHVNFDVWSEPLHLPGGASDLNWNELITKTTFYKTYYLTLTYSNDSWATDENGYYAGVGGSWSCRRFHRRCQLWPQHVQQQGIEDYSDCSVSLGRTFGPLSLSLYHRYRQGRRARRRRQRGRPRGVHRHRRG
jgi:hypothetical protein